MRKINQIIIHCSVSEFGDASLIEQWHKERGFKKIGYHYVVLNGKRTSKSEFDPIIDGIVERGRLDEEIGSHCKGDNRDSIGICLIGDKKFTSEQMISLYKLCINICNQYKITKIVGHRDTKTGKIQGKTCPNFDVVPFANEVLKYID